MKHNIRKQTLEEGAFVLLIAGVITKLIGAIFKIPLSSDSCLGDLGFGYFSAAYDFYTPLQTLALSGFPVAFSKVISDLAAKKEFGKLDETFRISFKFMARLGLVATCVLAFAFLPFAFLTDKSGQLKYSLFAILPAVFFCAVSSVYRGYFEGLCNMTPTAVSSVIEALTKLVLGFLLAVVIINLTQNPALGAAGAILGISAGNIFACLYLHLKFRPHKAVTFGKTDFCIDRAFKKALVLSALQIALASLSVNLVALVDTLTVRYQLGLTVKNNLEDLNLMYKSVFAQFASGSELTPDLIPTLLYGIKSKALTIFNLVPTLTIVVGISAIPIISSAFAVRDDNSLRKSIANTLRMSAVISFPAGFGCAFLSERIMSLLYDEGASSQLGGKFLLIYGFAAIFAGLSVTIACILQALGKQKQVFLNVILCLFAKICFNILLSGNPQINIFGSVYGTLINFALYFVLNIILLMKSVRGSLISKSIRKPFICGLASAVSAFAVTLFGKSSINTLIAIIIAVIVYLILLILLKSFSHGDILSLPCGNELFKLLKKLKLERYFIEN